MLHVSGADQTLAIVLKAKTTKKPSVIARFSKLTVDKVTIENGSEKITIDLFSATGETYHDTHSDYAKMIDDAIYAGPYAPTVLLNKGYISKDGFTTLSKNVITEEALNRDIILDDNFDYAGAMKSAIVNRSYGKSPVLTIAPSDS